MKVLDIKEIVADELPLYYRRKYKAVMVIEIPMKTLETPINFIIETDPLGRKIIDFDLQTRIDYPLVPLTKEIKTFIVNMEEKGLLI